MYITFLGSCANQTANREGVSFIVETEVTNCLIDVGPGIVSSFQKIKRETSEIDHVFLTHTHGDHILGFAYFVWNRNFERKGRTPANKLNVYGNAETITLAKQMLDGCYPNAAFDFEICYNVVELNKTYCIGDMTITPVRAIHPVPTLAIVIDNLKKKVVYSADSLPSDELAKYANMADMVIHEGMFVKDSINLSRIVMHSTAMDAAQFANKCSCKQLILVHIAPELFGNEKKLLKEASEYYGGLISIPCDGSLYTV